MDIKAKRYSANCYRLFERDALVGFAFKLSNGKWRITDTADRPLDSVPYGSPNEVAKCFKTVRLLTVL